VVLSQRTLVNSGIGSCVGGSSEFGISEIVTSSLLLLLSDLLGVDDGSEGVSSLLEIGVSSIVRSQSVYLFAGGV
jgi:hypothetical protein